MTDCIFCKIVKGEIPSHKIYEDKNIISFLTIEPVVHGHLLVVPKNHSRWLWDMDKKEYSALMEKTRHLANALRKTFDTEWIEEAVAGTGIEHTHVHLIPRKFDDGLPEIPIKIMNPKPSDEELKKIAERIKQNL